MELKEHPHLKGYFGTVDGRVYSNKWGKLKELFPSKLKSGYHLMCCYISKERMQIFHHRFIAQIFIPNPNNYSEIHHKDENKSNNSVENLEWCTRKYNQEQSLAKTYLVENLITGEKYEIHNLKKWCEKEKIHYSTALKNLRGEYNTIKSKTFKLSRTYSKNNNGR